MTLSLSWRRVTLGGLLLAALASVLALRAIPGADAQEPPPSATFVISDIEVTASNGNVNLGPDTGEEDGVLGIACTGAAPLGGTSRIPGMVVTDLGVADTRLRIAQPNGATVTGTVQINCVIEVVVTPEGTATVERLRQAANAG